MINTKENKAKQIIGSTTTFIGESGEHKYLKNYKVLIRGIIKNGVLPEGKGYDPDADDAYISDNDYLLEIGGVTANDRIDVQPWIEKVKRFSWVSSDARAVDLKMFSHLQNANNIKG